MRYEKPIVTSEKPAIDAIHGAPKHSKIGVDPDLDSGFVTCCAYEADE